MSAEPHSGGCQCGSVRYRIAGAVSGGGICHCRMCQKAFGSFFAPLVGVRREDFNVTRGTIATFASSDQAERGFCRDCGTPLTFSEPGSAKVEVAIGSLDDPAIAKPVKQVGTESRLPWFGELFNLPIKTTTENEPAERLHSIAASNRQHPDHDTSEWPPTERRA